MRAVEEIFIVGVSYGGWGIHTPWTEFASNSYWFCRLRELTDVGTVYCLLLSIVQEELNLALDLSLIGNPKVYLHLGLVFCEG